MYTKKDGQGGVARAPGRSLTAPLPPRKSGPKSHTSSSIMTEIERGTRREKKNRQILVRKDSYELCQLLRGLGTVMSA